MKNLVEQLGMAEVEEYEKFVWENTPFRLQKPKEMDQGNDEDADVGWLPYQRMITYHNMMISKTSSWPTSKKLKSKKRRRAGRSTLVSGKQKIIFFEKFLGLIAQLD